jgi:DNA mismatch repair ATPase MutS
MNQYLYDLREYLDYAIVNMKRFSSMHSEKTTYAPFCRDMDANCEILGSIREELESIEPFSHHLGKLGSLGYMLKCLYRIHDNPSYGTALKYSFSFEGYLDNLRGLYENLESNVVHLATFEKGSKTQIKEQYYPPHIDADHVKNNCKLEKNMIVSAPNASGKTTYLKTTAINIVLSQQFGCGFYESAVLEPYTHVHSYLNIPDTSGRDSLFQAESRRCKEIIDNVVKHGEDDSRHFCIFDELYSGTNPTEATKAAYGFLTYLNNCPHVDYILTTHYVAVCKKFKKSKLVQNYKMAVETDENGLIRYTYKLKRGISTIQGATKILQDMEYPKEILDTMEKY